MSQSTQEQVLRLVRQQGVLRPRDLDRHGLARTYVQRLYEQGKLERVGRGLYTLPEAPAGEHQSLAEAAKRVPHGVVCLLSALRFHELTTQSPSVVWLALDRKARLPKVDAPALRVVRFSGEALTAGVEVHELGGVAVRIYSPPKTVADCFKYRNKIGLDVALAALQDAWRKKKVSMKEIEMYAAICRVSRVMRPYLEALVA